MRPPSSRCTWRNCTSWFSVAEYSRTGTLTRPKETAPFQIARMAAHLSVCRAPPRARTQTPSLGRSGTRHRSTRRPWAASVGVAAGRSPWAGMPARRVARGSKGRNVGHRCPGPPAVEGAVFRAAVLVQRRCVGRVPQAVHGDGDPTVLEAGLRLSRGLRRSELPPNAVGNPVLAAVASRAPAPATKVPPLGREVVDSASPFGRAGAPAAWQCRHPAVSADEDEGVEGIERRRRARSTVGSVRRRAVGARRSPQPGRCLMRWWRLAQADQVGSLVGPVGQGARGRGRRSRAATLQPGNRHRPSRARTRARARARVGRSRSPGSRWGPGGPR